MAAVPPMTSRYHGQPTRQIKHPGEQRSDGRAATRGEGDDDRGQAWHPAHQDHAPEGKCERQLAAGIQDPRNLEQPGESERQDEQRGDRVSADQAERASSRRIEGLRSAGWLWR